MNTLRAGAALGGPAEGTASPVPGSGFTTVPGLMRSDPALQLEFSEGYLSALTMLSHTQYSCCEGNSYRNG